MLKCMFWGIQLEGKEDNSIKHSTLSGQYPKPERFGGLFLYSWIETTTQTQLSC